MHRTSSLAALIVLAVAPATAPAQARLTPGKMFPIDTVLIADSSILCVSHVDQQGDPWMIIEIAFIHPDLPALPFPEGTTFRVTGTYCTDCINPFCGSFDGFIFQGNLVPVVAGDVSADGQVDVQDLLQLLAAWGPCPDAPELCPEDLGGDGAVGIADLLALLAAWS